MLAHHLMTFEGWARAQKRTLEIPAAFAEIRAAGYAGVEMGGDAANCGPSSQLRRQLADAGLGLAAWSVSVTANPWAPSTEAFTRQIAYAAELGVGLAVVCGGFLPGGRRTVAPSDYRLFAENYLAHETIAAKAGITLAYHPHRGCLIETAAEVDAFLRFAPGLRLCPDTGHLAACLDDPLVLLDAHPARVVAMHLKDYDPVSGNFAELGRGRVDLAGVIAWIRRRGWTGPLIVERDAPPLPAAESALISRAWLKSQGI